MTDEHVDALVAAAADGVDLDGLRVTEDGGTFTFATASASQEGLDADEFRTVAREHPRFVSNWYVWAMVDRPAPETAFLRWLEDADDRAVPARYDALAEGLEAAWGELAIEVTLAEDGHRRYTVTHADDAGREVDALEVQSDPLDARELVKRDDRGRYRPLKAAPTLPTGWAFVDLDGRDLARTVECIYPASFANWDRERRGELDVGHWRETMARQTGMYGVIETWDRGEGHEHAERVAAACCRDSQCLKRREWEYDADTELAVDGGDGEFPCREPCALVLSGARTWTRLEGETPSTYRFELTPSEKRTLEAVVDAVADGDADDIGVGDLEHPANRYRVRYLRAKLFDEEGRLRTADGEDPDQTR